MRSSLSSSFAKVCLILCFAILAVSTAFAQVSGAIYTTFPSGTTVNGNIYPSKDQVYLSGGPQNKKDAGLSPAPGFYYFQVTDPSGSVLLSKDAVTCRVVYVNNSGGPGIVDGIPGTDGSDPTAGGFGTSTCYHNNGTQDDANGALPVQLCNPSSALCPTDFADTPNPGGEYKAWMTPVEDYVGPTGTCPTGANHFGFCDSLSKTDNFKIKAPGTAAITACKFIDTDGDSAFDPNTGDFLFAGWPITATGVDGGTVTQNTDQDGCTSFTVSSFTSGTATVTLTETLLAGYTQVAPTPLSGGPTACLFVSSNDNAATCSVTNGVITVTLSKDDVITAPYFGNALIPNTPPPVQVSKTASGGNSFVWNVAKSVDKTEIDDSSGSATFNYTVTVGHDGGTGWVVGGVISFVNPDPDSDQNIAALTDATNVGGTCMVPDFVNPTTIPKGGSPVNLNYTCTFTTNPGPGTNTATADSLTPATANFDFSSADTSAAITDTIAKNLGTVTINADNSTSCPASAPAGFVGTNWACSVDPKTGTATFTYSETFTDDPAGTCTSHDNTATFTTNTNVTGNSTDVTVKQCVGKDLTVVKTAAASFNSSVSKSVDKTKVEQSGGNVTFNYTVTVSEDTWLVKGTITVSNPNNWESITANVTDSIDSGGTCTVTGGSGVVIAASSSSAALPYSCTYTTNPTKISGTNTATATVTAGITPSSSVQGTAPYTFATLTVTDTVQSSAYPGPTGCTATLGTVDVILAGTTPNNGTGKPGCGITGLTSPHWGVFKYSITDTNAAPGLCVSYTNTASIPGSSSSVTVTVCNTGTGALTMGFWKNTNGAKIITSYCGGTGISLHTFLTSYNPYKDDPATTCKGEASYVATVIGGATCSTGGYCNTMLRAQMLSTALDVYFSTPGLGGNQIGAYNGLGSKTPALGGIAIDLSHICSMADGSSGSTCTGTYEDARYEFGIVTTGGCLGTTVSQMLSYANFASGVNGNPVATANTGASWYLQNKGKQVFAKDGFDNTNNQIANIVPSGPGVCSSTF